MDGSTIFFDALFRYANLRGYDDEREKKLYAVNAKGSHMEEILDLSYQVFPPTGFVVDDWYRRFYHSVHLGSDGYFDISPDMSRIVYSTCRYQIQPEHSGAGRTWDYPDYGSLMYSYEIAVSSMDGEDIRRLTDDGDADYNYPSWSPDGQRIAFLAARSTYYQFLRRNAPGPLPDPYNKLLTMTADGSDLREVASLTIAPYPPVWSPDGQRIAFLAEEETEEEPGEDSLPQRAIYVVGSDGSNLMRVSGAISPPSWSPDGRRLAFARRHGDDASIFTIGADGSYPWMVTDITEDIESSKANGYKFDGKLPLRDHWVDRVLWSPDGKRIAFTCSTLCVVDEDGSSLVRSPVQPYGWSIPDWSPDGSRVAVLIADDIHPITPRIVLYTMSLDGTDVQSLVQGNWSLVAENSGWEDLDANIESCAGGYVVPEPKKNPGLVVDCTTLVTIRDALVGEAVHSADLLILRLNNWNGDTPIDQWLGVTVGGSPRRVVALELPGYLHGVGRFTLSRQLFGVIPPELGRLTGLRTLNLANNSLTGVIPPELGRLWKLENLYLQGNAFGGSIPPELGGLANLRKMEIGSNQLTGVIPPELGNLTSLEELGLVRNRLTGNIPPELGNLVNLKELILTGDELYGDQFTGPIPAELGNMTRLKVLNLRWNQLTGSIPPELGSLGSLEDLNLGGNQLTGSIPPELGSLGSLEDLNLGGNQLTGSIPPELGSLGSLGALDLGWNRLTGSIPPELGSLGSLGALDLRWNRLTGSIPSELGNLTNLHWVYLHGNQFTGCVPRGLAKKILHFDELGLPPCEESSDGR